MKKKFTLFDVVLSVICVVFVAEAAAPVAALGNSQYFWRILMIVTFFVPYGLISSELGTAYQGEGGLYDWIVKAYPGTRWGARAAWYYWLNFPLWMASLAVMVPDMLVIAFGIEINLGMSLALQLIFILTVTIIACFPVCDSVIILNICAVIKVGLSLLVGGMGVHFVIQNGFVNDMRAVTFLPTFDQHSLSFISVILFTMLGFEVVCTLSDEMKNPKKEIPQGIIVGGLVIAAVYLFGGFGIGASIPPSEVNADSGLVEAVMIMSGKEESFFISAVALLFLVTLFGNMISWSLGVNNTACYAAERGDMPAVFTQRWVKNRMPISAAFINGIVAAVVCLLGVVMTLIAPESELFWTFFSLNIVLFLLSYLPIFPAFLKLRRIDPDTERPFKVPGGPVLLKLMAYVPFAWIVISTIICTVPLSFDAETLVSVLPITIGAIICIVIGEALTASRVKKNKVFKDQTSAYLPPRLREKTKRKTR